MSAVHLADIDTQVVVIVVEDGAKTVLLHLVRASRNFELAVLYVLFAIPLCTVPISSMHAVLFVLRPAL